MLAIGRLCLALAAFVGLLAPAAAQDYPARTTNETLLPNKPFQLMRDFVPAAPGDLNYASSGPGTPYHMAGELFEAMSGTNIVHVAHRGSGDARTAVMGGHVQMMIDAITTTAPTVQAGQVRALGTTGLKRSSVLPEVPTIAEAGLPGYAATIWLGVIAPAGTPAAVVDKLNSEINQVLKRPETREAWAKQGAEPLIMTPAEFDTYLRGDIDKWAKMIHTAGIKVQ